jgi:hypothetical protein
MGFLRKTVENILDRVNPSGEGASTKWKPFTVQYVSSTEFWIWLSLNSNNRRTQDGLGRMLRKDIVRGPIGPPDLFQKKPAFSAAFTTCVLTHNTTPLIHPFSSSFSTISLKRPQPPRNTTDVLEHDSYTVSHTWRYSTRC